MLTRYVGNSIFGLIGAWFVVALFIGSVTYFTKPPRDCMMESVAAGMMWPVAVIGYTDTYYSMIGVGRVMCNEARQTARTVHRDYLLR